MSATSRDGQSVYTATRGNDVLEHLVDQFEKGWKQRGNNQPCTATESTNVQAAINTILTSTSRYPY
jgi:hypothetical protein